MKRLWIGTGLLALVLVLGIWTGSRMKAVHIPTAEDLEDAALWAMRDEWGQAEAHAARAKKNWDKNRPMTASVADHEPMDDIDALFAELEVFAARQDQMAYSSLCVHLAEELKALSEEHRLFWWNLL